MGIVEVEVCNFKSYSGVQTLGPFKTFTAVVGPNGAGKSNVMDALCFALGLKSAQLRGHNLGDLVHARGEGRIAPSSGYVEIVFEETPGKARLRFKRSVTRSGSSEYFIDGKSISWKKYEQSLLSVGINVKAKNFLVFQGDVECIAQKSPSELVELFDQISGSAELKDEYSRLDQEAADRESEYLLAFDRRKNLAKERKLVKEQKDEAEKYKDLLIQKQRILGNFFLWQLYHMKKDAVETWKAVSVKKAELAELQKEVHAHQVSKTVVSKAIGKSRVKRSDVEKRLSKLQNVLDAETTNLIDAEEHVSKFAKAIKESQNSLKKLDKEHADQLSRIRNIENQLKIAQVSLEKFNQETEQFGSQDLAMNDTQLQDYQRLKLEAAQKSAHLLEEKERLRQESVSKKAILERSTQNLESLQMQVQSLDQPVELLIERRERIQSEIESLANQYESLQKDYEKLKAQRLQAEKEKSHTLSQLEKVTEVLQNAKADIHQSEKDKKMADCVSSLRRLYPSVHGRISDLCKPTQKKYNSAVTIALGSYFDAIVVDDEKTAIECIHYMKDQRIGVATFLPLDTLQVKKIREANRHLGGSLKLVVDVIQYDEGLSKAFEFVLGNTLVCDSLNEARSFSYDPRNLDQDGRIAFKVVTLDGSVIHKNGNMTGGVSGVEDKSRRWDDAEIRSARSKRESLLQELNRLDGIISQQQSEIQMSYKIADNSENRRYLQKDLLSLEAELERWSRNQKSIQKKLSVEEKQKNRLLEELAASVAKEKKITKNLASIENQVFAEFSQKMGIDNIVEFEENRLAKFKEHAEKRIEINDLISNLRSALENEKSSSYDSAKQSIETRISKDQNAMNAMKQRIETLKNKITNVSSEIEQLDGEIRAILSENDGLVKELKKTEENISSIQASVRNAESEISSLESQIQVITSKLADILREAQVEQIDIPLKHEVQVNDSDSEGHLTIENSSDEPKRMGELSRIDFKDLKEHKSIRSVEQYNRIKADYIAKISDMTAKIGSMNPNLKSIEKFEEINERFRVCTEEFEQSKNLSREASQKFEACKEERSKRFITAFEHVADEIDGIYKAMTRSDRFPMGGSASLSLDSPDVPFESGIRFYAMPPLKRFRDMEQLSGGEKTVAALALLFAIHSFNPSPFFVLDEIDAALDSTNVQRVVTYIKNRASQDRVQFIVISLKDAFFEHADSLVGIYKDIHQQSSGSLTLDLTRYQ